MSATRDHLADLLSGYYGGSGFRVERRPDGTVAGHGFGGVTWIGLPVVRSDLDDPAFPDRLRALSEVRMPTGELCPLELLPDDACGDDLRALLVDLHLSDRGHVQVYTVVSSSPRT
ncbi:hypothetical protein [Gaiella sp.]|uniref:hypothetical protein n=1 Tax=Gaiella sp. TaxID=2663207 RepID=UPI002E35BDB0|nr:hypothetical protein [Gaiella sp.]HEX5584129.1 hypothetical protein [Gaiella sp.]